MGNNVKRSVRARMKKSPGFGNEAARRPSKEGTSWHWWYSSEHSCLPKEDTHVKKQRHMSRTL